ncbi:unnamed protein product [Aspergillus oryzae RIB40]|uniref:DNA, SC005 n=1 Tax=Aspergillus oryzae (strain ATCC 42149 / RIB 40) TaxID=510516 RepID=Q2URZ5_ASPOR|nr:unnamed protein product [Aspergillus oryzae RIB40]BAE55670.1 unnamed protein product [Aspergillus oryzae RIB40]
MDGSIPPPSAISPISPSPSTSSAIFRPRRSDDWHEYRPIIEQLYRDNQLKLRDVKRIMERDYKFHASHVPLELRFYLYYHFEPWINPRLCLPLLLQSIWFYFPFSPKAHAEWEQFKNTPNA